jgi:hypothetical protein
MTDDKGRHRRWISLGEMIALGALIVSALGVWIAWKSSSPPAQDKPTRVVEQRQPIPLTLRGTVERDGRSLVIAPVEPSHALESLSLAIEGARPIEAGSDGRIDAGDVESILNKREAEPKGAHEVPVRITARYVELGADRRGGGAYVLRYRWEGGGLFGSRELRLTGLGRA